MEAGEIGREAESAGKRFSKAEALRLWRVLDEKRAEDRLREMVENTPDNYWLITDEGALDELLRLLDDEDEIVFDVETTGTDVWSDQDRKSTRLNYSHVSISYVVFCLKTQKRI